MADTSDRPSEAVRRAGKARKARATRERRASGSDSESVDPTSESRSKPPEGRSTKPVTRA